MKNFFEKTAAAAFDVLLSSTHDIAWQYGPFGEGFGAYTFAFLGSTVSLESPQPMEEESGPLPHEASVTIDWNLVMTESAQAMFFQRVVSHWNRTTGSFAVTVKKKYRLSQEELLKLRNLIVLFDQLLPHMKTRLSPEMADSWIEDIIAGSKRDDDLQGLLQLRPSRFSMSMLQSEQNAVKKDLLEAEQRKVCDKEEQQAAVDAAQWSYFKGALCRDQEKLLVAQAAPKKVRAQLHAKSVAHTAKQAADGEAACRGYQDGGVITCGGLWSQGVNFLM